MEWPAQVQAVVAVIALVVAIFGFALVIRQLRLLKGTLRSDTNARLSEQSITILAYIADRPYLYDYLYASKPFNETDEHRVHGLVESTLDDLEPEVRERWVRSIMDTLAKSPALCDFISKYRVWYPKKLVDRMS